MTDRTPPAYLKPPGQVAPTSVGALSIDEMQRQSTVLAAMGQRVYEWCERKGWEPEPSRTFGDELALLHSEISEALEAWRDHGTKAWVEDVSQDPDNHIRFVEGAQYGGKKPEGVPSEFADLLIRLLHYAKVHGIDLWAEFDAKMHYNETRAWRHGGRAL